MHTRKISVIHYHPAHSFPKIRLSILTRTPFIINYYRPLPSSTDKQLELINSDYSVINIEPSLNTQLHMDCTVCGEKTSGVHSCPHCRLYFHTICGRQVGEEGYGSSGEFPACDIS